MRIQRFVGAASISFAFLLFVSLFVVSCTSSGTDTTIVAPPSSTSSTVTTSTSLTTSTTAPPAPPQEHWISIEGDSFVDTRTESPFVPIGVNLLLKVGGGGGDRMFALYDPEWVDTQLDGIVSLGMNTVRFFLDMCMECTTTNSGIRPEYLDNLADLLTRLEAHGLVALPTSNDVPDPGFSNRLPCCEPFGGYRNSLYLAPEGQQIAIEYWTQLIEGVKERGAPTHHILGWQLANEQFYLRDVPPISTTTGSVTTADGETYDLADDSAVDSMVVNNLRSYVTNVGNAIREVDEGALITMGFFSAEDPESGRVGLDNRWVIPDDILADSTLDFVDLHAYPGLGGEWDAIASSYGIADEEPPSPILLGEFGAFESAYVTPSEGAAAMARWQSASCEYGFDGWLLWFWGADKDDEVIPVDVDDAAIARAISPAVRPDPCDVGPFESSNLALGRPTTASAQESDTYGSNKVTDGSDATWWSAGAGPPQWVEIDLEEGRTVGRVEILIGHVSPPGPQTHRVYLRGPDQSGKGELAGEIQANAAQGDVLTITFEPATDIRYVRVETTRMDGWVILHEIRVFADEQ
ncbi:MAG: discoidin domain-containing protein [Acidimicrobiia bacterium]|nr:discoidin domain-containing protein [Acidimicrobiia bacterium]